MSYSVRQARMLAGLSQQEIADRLNVHRTTYRKLEENPDLITIGQAREISRAVGVPLDDIFFAPNSTKSRN